VQACAAGAKERRATGGVSMAGKHSSAVQERRGAPRPGHRHIVSASVSATHRTRTRATARRPLDLGGWGSSAPRLPTGKDAPQRNGLEKESPRHFESLSRRWTLGPVCRRGRGGAGPSGLDRKVRRALTVRLVDFRSTARPENDPFLQRRLTLNLVGGTHFILYAYL
jgi:hypothetical protein